MELLLEVEIVHHLNEKVEAEVSVRGDDLQADHDPEVVHDPLRFRLNDVDLSFIKSNSVTSTILKFKKVVVVS